MPQISAEWALIHCLPHGLMLILRAELHNFDFRCLEVWCQKNTHRCFQCKPCSAPSKHQVRCVKRFFIFYSCSEFALQCKVRTVNENCKTSCSLICGSCTSIHYMYQWIDCLIVICFVFFQNFSSWHLPQNYHKFKSTKSITTASTSSGFNIIWFEQC